MSRPTLADQAQAAETRERDAGVLRELLEAMCAGLTECPPDALDPATVAAMRAIDGPLCALRDRVVADHETATGECMRLRRLAVAS